MGWREDLRSGVDAWGITDGYHDIEGRWHATTDSAREALRAAMGSPEPSVPLWVVTAGHHHDMWSECSVELEDGGWRGPGRSLPTDLPLGYHWLVPSDGGARTRLIVAPPCCAELPRGWGVAVQIYALHSDGSQGMGDLADLTTIMRWVAQHSGSAVLINPLHEPRLHPTVENSPYFPNTRRRRDPLMLRVDGLAPLRSTLIQRNEVWDRKSSALRDGYDRAAPDEPFEKWVAQQVEAQIDACRAAAPDVALIGDLAVGFAPDGDDAIDFAEALAAEYEVGAPPDGFNADGQRWGLAPFVPWRLRALHYQPLIDTLRATLRGMSGLRIDHVMGLFRQFWIPRGGSASEGAYVRVQADELLAIVALEAARAGAFLIGEDLGTVEPAVREALDEYGIAGTNVLWFSEGTPGTWRTDCLATITTHDLPTITGVLNGTDGDESMREKLAASMDDFPLMEPVIKPVINVKSVHRSLLASPAALRLMSVDDLAGAERRPNLPGTTDDQRPNWRIPLPISVEDLINTSPVPTEPTR